MSIALYWAALFSSVAYSLPRTGEEIESGGLGLLDVVRGGGPILLGVAAAFVRAQPAQDKARITTVQVGLVAFLAVCLLSTSWSVDPRATMLKSLALAGLYFAVYGLVREYGSVAAVVKGAVAAVYMVLVWTAIQVLFAPSIAYAADDNTGIRRLASVAPGIGANPLSYLAIAGLLGIVLNIGPRWMQKNWVLSGAMAALFVLEILATRTRTALIVGSFVIAISLVLSFCRRPVLVTYLGLAGALLGLVASQSSVLYAFLLRGQDEQGLSSLTGRTDNWTVAYSAFLENPWLGLGFFSGHRLGLQELKGYGIASNLDNTWLEILVDVGLVGLIPLVIFVVGGLVAAYRSLDLKRSESIWICAVLTYGSLISFVSPTVQLAGANMLLMSIAILAACQDMDRRDHVFEGPQ